MGETREARRAGIQAESRVVAAENSTVSPMTSGETTSGIPWSASMINWETIPWVSFSRIPTPAMAPRMPSGMPTAAMAPASVSTMRRICAEVAPTLANMPNCFLRSPIEMANAL